MRAFDTRCSLLQQLFFGTEQDQMIVSQILVLFPRFSVLQQASLSR